MRKCPDLTKCVISQIQKVADRGRDESRPYLIGLSIWRSNVGPQFIAPELLSRNTPTS